MAIDTDCRQQRYESYPYLCYNHFKETDNKCKQQQDQKLSHGGGTVIALANIILAKKSMNDG